jgi:hypothetical protein
MTLLGDCLVIATVAAPLHLLVLLVSAADHQAAQPAPVSQSAPSGTGRVAVTLTLDSLRVPAMNVELRNVDTNVVVARSTSDAVGRVMFPDIPTGRYSAHATRDGFVDADSSPFVVRPGVTEQILLEVQLTFVRESVDVVAPSNSPTQSV